MKTNFTEIAKKVADGTCEFIENPSALVGATFSGVALGILELTNINTLDPSAINLSQMEGAAVASGIGLLMAGATKYATRKKEMIESYNADNPGENERNNGPKESKYDAKMSAMGL